MPSSALCEHCMHTVHTQGRAGELPVRVLKKTKAEKECVSQDSFKWIPRKTFLVLGRKLRAPFGG